jgi:hypothetical protein
LAGALPSCPCAVGRSIAPTRITKATSTLHATPINVLVEVIFIRVRASTLEKLDLCNAKRMPIIRERGAVKWPLCELEGTFDGEGE